MKTNNFSRYTFMLVIITSLIFIIGFTPQQATAQGTSSVIILVVDDFSGAQDGVWNYVQNLYNNGVSLKDLIANYSGNVLDAMNTHDSSGGSAWSSNANDYCVLANDGQRMHSLGMGGDGSALAQLETQGIYHGHLVSWHTEDIVNSVGINVTVQKVDIPGFNLNFVSNAVSRAVEEALYNYEHVVVNMSFAMVPCNTMVDVLAYEAAVVSDPSGAAAARGKIGDAISTAMSGAYLPAGTWAQLIPDGMLAQGANQNVAFVASAGNYSMGFPLYPALFPDVIAVSAGAPTGNPFNAKSMYGFSNSGEDLMPGVYYVNAGNLSNFETRGTTFASPAMSSLLALLFYYDDSGIMKNECFDGSTYQPFTTQGQTNYSLAYFVDTWFSPCEFAGETLSNNGLIP